MEKTMLIIGLVWPEPTSSAAGWRILQLIDLFLSEGYHIHFACAASKSAYSFPLSSKGIIEKEILLNDSSFDVYVKELNPKIVLFDRFMVEEQYSWRVAQGCPDALRILDTEDLHFVRHARQEAYKKGWDFNESLLFSDMAKREIASIYRSDLSLIISPEEIKILQEQFKVDSNILSYLPFQVLDSEGEKPGYRTRAHFMFIGNFLHEPNWKTVQILKEILPSIRKKLPMAELHIYGAYPSEKVWQLNNPKQGFKIMGRADHAVATLKKYRALLAPIPFGAGLKGKFIDALSAGTPSVCSKIAVEGMETELPWPGFVTDNMEEFVNYAVLLYQNEEQWNTCFQYGEQALQTLQDSDWGKELIIQLDSIEDNLENHRQRNFIGQILWTNQFLSSKYLSQWIEEKNKKAHP